MQKYKCTIITCHFSFLFSTNTLCLGLFPPSLSMPSYEQQHLPLPKCSSVQLGFLLPALHVYGPVQSFFLAIAIACHNLGLDTTLSEYTHWSTRDQELCGRILNLDCMSLDVRIEEYSKHNVNVAETASSHNPSKFSLIEVQKSHHPSRLQFSLSQQNCFTYLIIHLTVNTHQHVTTNTFLPSNPEYRQRIMSSTPILPLFNDTDEHIDATS